MYGIFMTTDLADMWVKDSVKETLEELADYILENKWKLDKVAGPNGEWSVHHYEPDSNKRLSELSLSEEETRKLIDILNKKEAKQ